MKISSNRLAIVRFLRNIEIASIERNIIFIYITFILNIIMNKFSENFISSIIKNVKKECLMKGTIPSDRLVLSLFMLLNLNPKFSSENQIHHKQYESLFIEYMVGFLKQPDHPSIATLKIQIYFKHNNINKDYIISTKNENIRSSTEKLLNVILEKYDLKTRKDSHQLYHHISCYIILSSGIGDPTDDNLLKETIGGLKSVLGTKELLKFVSKPIVLKRKQLQDILRIVTGISIYNKDTKKNEDMFDLLSILEKAIQKCYNYLECKLREIEERISSFIHLFSRLNSNVVINFEKLFSREIFHNEFFEAEHYIKSYIIFLQQLAVFLRILIQKNISLSDEYKSCSTELQQHLIRIRKTIKFRTAIPVIEIYPQFKNVSMSWDKMQELSTLLAKLSETVSYIFDVYEKIPEPQLNIISDKLKYRIAKQESSSPVKNVIITNANCELIMLENVEDFYGIETEYSGFCCVTFVETTGILILGIKEYGLIKYSNSYYCFSSIKAMTKFCENPKMFVDTMKSVVFMWPETINLLQMKKYFKADINKPTKSNDQLIFKDSEIQTEIHPIPAYKDNNYVSNIWQLKKQIHLTENKKCRTHSAQTDISNFRKSVSTQT